MTLASRPTLAGYLAFLRDTVQITTVYLPDNAPVIEETYCIARDTVNLAFCKVVPRIYTLMVYNLATSFLLAWAPDQADKTYFADLRAKWKINDFLSGVVESTSDNGSSESMVVQEAAKNFTIANLQQLKDPYGRQYLGWAQSYGSLWGIS